MGFTFTKHHHHLLRRCESDHERSILNAFLSLAWEGYGGMTFLMNGGELELPMRHLGKHTFIGSWRVDSPGHRHQALGFYMQADLEQFRVDFLLTGYAFSLIVEVDGSQHSETRKRDCERDFVLMPHASTLRVDAADAMHRPREIATRLLDVAVTRNSSVMLGQALNYAGDFAQVTSTELGWHHTPSIICRDSGSMDASPPVLLSRGMFIEDLKAEAERHSKRIFRTAAEWINGDLKMRAACFRDYDGNNGILFAGDSAAVNGLIGDRPAIVKCPECGRYFDCMPNRVANLWPVRLCCSTSCERKHETNPPGVYTRCTCCHVRGLPAAPGSRAEIRDSEELIAREVIETVAKKTMN
jgi:very-short-patch-repair endonuclease